MVNGNDWKWIKEVFSNKLVLLCIVFVLILGYYFTQSEGKLKWAVLAMAVVIIVIALIFQWRDQRVTKKVEKQVITESSEEEKEVLRKYIKWDEETKKIFEMFLNTDCLYYEIEQNNSLLIRTHLERDIRKITGKIKEGYSFTHTIRTTEEMARVDNFIKQGITLKTKSKEGEPFTFKLKLTKKGKILLENIRKINTLSE